MKNTITEILKKYTRKNSRLDDTEWTGRQRFRNPWSWAKKKKNDDRFRDLRDNIKPIRVPEGEERWRGRGHIWIHESWKLPQPGKGNRHPGPGSTNRNSPQRTALRHAAIKMAKMKDILLYLDINIISYKYKGI